MNILLGENKPLTNLVRGPYKQLVCITLPAYIIYTGD